MVPEGSLFANFSNNTQQHHPTENLPISRGNGYENHHLTAERISWDVLAAELTTPPEIGPKDGAYICFGHYAGNYLSGEPITGLAAFGYDGDKSHAVHPDTGAFLLNEKGREVLVSGAPAPQAVHAALTAAGIRHCLWTTHSHMGTDEQGLPIGPRWRAVFTLTRPVVGSEERRAVEAYIRLGLHGRGLLVAPSGESISPVRLWYTPRVPAERRDLYFSARHDAGRAIDVDAAVTWYRAEVAPQEAARCSAPGEPGRPAGDSDSIFGWYTASLHADEPDCATGVEQLCDFLERRGYVRRGRDDKDGSRGYRMLTPNSSTGTPGIHVYRPAGLPHAAAYCFHAGHVLARDANTIRDAGEQGSMVSTVVGLLDFEGDWSAFAKWLERLKQAIETGAAKQRLLDGVGEHAPALEALAALFPEDPAFAAGVAELHRASKRAFGLRDIKRWAGQLRELNGRPLQVTVEPGTWWPALGGDGTPVDLAPIQEERARRRRERKWAEAREAFKDVPFIDEAGNVHERPKPLPRAWLPSDETPIVDSARDIYAELQARGAAYMNNRQVVTLEPYAGANARNAGRVQILPMKAHRFRSYLEQYFSLWQYRRSQKTGEMEPTSTTCSHDQASSLLEAVDVFGNILDPLNLVADKPVLFHDRAAGELRRLSKGYHREAGIFVVSDLDIPEVPIEEAVAALLELVRDFDFATAGDRSRWIAAAVGMRMRIAGLFAGAMYPVDYIEADESQAGKTLLDKTVSAVNGEPAFVIPPRRGGVGSLDESLATAFARGRVRVRIDNYRGRLDSAYLEAAITAGTDLVGARAPHQAEVSVDLSRVSVSCTSNDATLTRDMANRINPIGLRHRSPGYKFKPWPEGGLLAHIEARQGYYLGCLDSVVQRWFRDGKRRNVVTDHDAREWAGAMDFIVQTYFGQVPLLTGYDSVKARLALPSRAWIRTVCQEVEKGGMLGDSLTASDIVDLMEEAGIEYPNGHTYTGAARADGARYVGRIIGKAFVAAFLELKDVQASQGAGKDRGLVFDQRWMLSRSAAHMTPPSASSTPSFSRDFWQWQYAVEKYSADLRPKMPKKYL